MNPITAAILTVSDRCSSGAMHDQSGPAIASRLLEAGYMPAPPRLVADDVEAITKAIIEMCEEGAALVISTGGTGFAPRDVTPEATRQVVEREAPGIQEMLRAAGNLHNPLAALSRGVAGIRGSTLIVNLPGSLSAVQESMETLVPVLPHALDILLGRKVAHGAPEKRAGEETPPTLIASLETNIDDMSPEFYEILCDRLLAAGALDVYITPIQMKKNRPGCLFTVLCAVPDSGAMAEILFRETSTFGVRRSLLHREVAQRSWLTVETEFGPIRIKVGKIGSAETSASPEYADVKEAAIRTGAPPKQVSLAAMVAYSRRK